MHRSCLMPSVTKTSHGLMDSASGADGVLTSEGAHVSVSCVLQITSGFLATMRPNSRIWQKCGSTGWPLQDSRYQLANAPGASHQKDQSVGCEIKVKGITVSFTPASVGFDALGTRLTSDDYHELEFNNRVSRGRSA